MPIHFEKITNLDASRCNQCLERSQIVLHIASFELALCIPCVAELLRQCSKEFK